MLIVLGDIISFYFSWCETDLILIIRIWLWATILRPSKKICSRRDNIIKERLSSAAYSSKVPKWGNPRGRRGRNKWWWKKWWRKLFWYIQICVMLWLIRLISCFKYLHYLSDCNWNRTHDHLLWKQTLNCQPLSQTGQMIELCCEYLTLQYI